MESTDALFSTPVMAAVFAPEAHVQQMLAFEGALARAQARAGLIPADAAAAISAACRSERFDIPALYHDASRAGTLVIPLVKALTTRVEGEAGRFVHWGATSQDVIDTALVLQMREGLDLLINSLLDLAGECATLAERYRHTPMAGRTLLQQALPITFGLKAARWLSVTARQVRRLQELRDRTLVVQFGGAAGTLASLGADGLRVTELLGEELGLASPDLPWHTERDRVGEVAGTLGVVAGSMAKMAYDIALLSQTEAGEIVEGTAPGKGGSSAMPHKRNPVDVTMARAAARLAIGMVPVILGAMEQEHERGAGGWQAEWAALPDLFRYTSGAVWRVRSAVAGLEVDPERIRSNLELTGGLIMAESLTLALATHVGKPEAYRIVKVACECAVAANSDLRQVALDDEAIRSVLSSGDIERALDPLAYLGSTDAFIDRALTAYREVQHTRLDK